MPIHSRGIHKAYYISKLSFVYLLTLAFVWYCIRPHHQNIVLTSGANNVRLASNDTSLNSVSGIPVRLVIPGSAVDIPIIEGSYNPNAETWTLSGYMAQYDISSTPANNLVGDTFIYGHNNDFVFGSLRHNTPTNGATAYVYTNNGHILQYSFIKTYSLSPSDTSVLVYNGPPTLTIQTCTGALNQWRTMFIFNFDRVVS